MSSDRDGHINSSTVACTKRTSLLRATYNALGLTSMKRLPPLQGLRQFEHCLQLLLGLDYRFITWTLKWRSSTEILTKRSMWNSLRDTLSLVKKISSFF